MLVIFPYCSKDEQQALKLSAWIKELGGCKSHSVFVTRSSDTNLSINAEIEDNLRESFAAIVKTQSIKDNFKHWPESPNQLFCDTARSIEYFFPNEPAFLWIEPDSIPLTPKWLDTISDRYQKSGKPFLGAMVPAFHDSPLHMSGIGVYRNPLIKYAGVMLMSAGEPVPFDLIAAPQVAAQAHFTDLIQHKWSNTSNPNPPFISLEDMKERMTSECVLYHSDKSGSICDVLRARPVSAEDKHQCKDEEMRQPKEGETNNGMVYSNGAWHTHLKEEILASEHGNIQADSSCEAVSKSPKLKRQSSLLERRQAQAAKAREALALKRKDSPVSKDNKQPCSVENNGITPWENKLDSICEINKLVQRLYKFCDAPMHVKRVRDELKKVGVIR